MFSLKICIYILEEIPGEKLGYFSTFKMSVGSRLGTEIENKLKTTAMEDMYSFPIIDLTNYSKLCDLQQYKRII